MNSRWKGLGVCCCAAALLVLALAGPPADAAEQSEVKFARLECSGRARGRRKAAGL